MAFSTRLFVGNIPEKITEDALRKEFSVYGDITNIDVKTKPGAENDKKVFAFVTLSASNFNVESCIKKFADEDCFGQRLYVTRARESFLERLQREREQTQQKNNASSQVLHENVPLPKSIKQLNNNLNKKRKFAEDENFDDYKELETKESRKKEVTQPKEQNGHVQKLPQQDLKKLDSDQKRLESIKRKRQEFNQKKNIIKTGLISIDKQANKKVIFSDAEDDDNKNINEPSNLTNNEGSTKRRVDLFDDDESEDDTNFDMKKQFEGKKGQKVLELQSRYKADKRFTLDERFVDDESDNDNVGDEEAVDLGQVDEKSKQLNILQDVLGVTIKSKSSDARDKTKAKPGMLRFDPSHPEHSKFLAPMEQKPETKKAKKKKNKGVQEEVQEKQEIVVEKVEVSKDQFYKVSDTLKEAMTQPKEFSLRSLFAHDNNDEEEATEQNTDYIPIASKKDKKIRNPLDPGEKNPFVYDSSDSENEEENYTEKPTKTDVQNVEPKAVWRENFFFSENDDRLKDGLLFFTQKTDSEPTKDRRELKSLMKKRIYNKERKNQMFKKKIGGRKKSMKKSFRKKS